MFAELFAEHGLPLYRTCLRLCGNPTDAEDLVADTFLAAHQGRNRFKGQASLKNWLFRIAMFKWHDLRKKSHRRDQALSEEMPAFVSERIGDIAIEQALRAIPESNRSAFLLVRIEDFSYREAAEILRVPEGTVKARVHDAAKKLRDLLGFENHAPACEVRRWIVSEPENA